MSPVGAYREGRQDRESFQQRDANAMLHPIHNTRMHIRRLCHLEVAQLVALTKLMQREQIVPNEWDGHRLLFSDGL